MTAASSPHSYQYRSTSVSPKFNSYFEKFHTNFLDSISTSVESDRQFVCDLVEESRLLLTEIGNGDENPRYTETLPGIFTDKYFLIEALGAMKSARKYQSVFTLLPAYYQLLGFILNEDPEYVQSVICNYCKQNSLSLFQFVYYLCSANLAKLEQIGLEFLLDIPSVKNAFKAFKPTQQRDVSTFSEFMYKIIHSMLVLQQYILFELVENSENTLTKSSPVVGSKGMWGIVFHNHTLSTPEIEDIYLDSRKLNTLFLNARNGCFISELYRSMYADIWKV